MGACMTKTGHIVSSLAFFGSALVMAPASAAVITFGALPGNNGDPFTSYAEAGFTVMKDSGSGCVGKVFGNPVPNVFGGTACDSGSVGVFTVTGGLFEFAGIDLAANNGTLSYSITGLLNGSNVFVQSNDLAGPTGVFSTIASQSNAVIDSLQLSFRTAGSSFNFDNINLTQRVSEPASGLLALAAFGVMIGALRSRRRLAA